jgi:hypothetical protein
MSLDNTSHPGRPGLDELVPSRYALRVGEIDVMVVSDGVLSLPGAMLGHNADPAARAAWLEDMFLPPSDVADRADRRAADLALRFLQTSPRGDSPCVIANPSPPSVGLLLQVRPIRQRHRERSDRPRCASPAREWSRSIFLTLISPPS